MTTSKKKKKSARERRVLVASIICAGLIVAGSTFAWFTSTDEVTNRLSASAEYGVAIAESFQPPENWVPGQEINKDASAVNTGNVDAFVRMWLDGNMRLLQQSKTAANTNAKYDTTNSFNTITGALTDVQDVNLTNLNLTRMDTNGNYFRTLDKTQTWNPQSSFDTNDNGYAGNEDGKNTNTGAYSEVQAMQSGILAYAPANASYSYVLDEETELTIAVNRPDASSNPVITYEKVQVPAGTLVMVTDEITDSANADHAATVNSTTGAVTPYATGVEVTATSGKKHTYTSTVYVKKEATFTVPKNVEYESFTPMSDGLYLFLRNEADSDQADPEFSGYYATGIVTTTGSATTIDPSKGTFYALNTGVVGNGTAPTYRSNYTVKGAETAAYTAPVQITYDNGTGTDKKNIIKVEPTVNLELYTAQYEDVVGDKLVWRAGVVDQTNKTQTIYAIYDKSANGSGSADNEFSENDDVVVEITLANIDSTAAEAWTSIGNSNTTSPYTIKTGLAPNIDASKIKFYYNNDVEAGDTSKKLVDKVKLFDGVTNNAYLAFDFDLNVHLDSVQVTFDENGKEQDTAINTTGGATWKQSATTGGATGARQNDDDKEITLITWTATTT